MSREDSHGASRAEQADFGDIIAVFAYLDDTIVGGPVELAGQALPLAVETFARAGHAVHPGKSARWSHSTPQEALPDICQRIWRPQGLKVGGIPVFNAALDPELAREMLEKRLTQIQSEADFLTSVIFDDQKAAADTWCRAQSVVLLL